MSGFGAFGKMPSEGDFFTIDLPPGFTEPWDNWLQRSIRATRAALGDRWSECYNAAPIWRFTLGPDVACPAPMAGVVTPSVDKVGRQFPLTFARDASPWATPLAAHMALDPVFEELETLALRVLDEDLSIDTLRISLRSAADVAVRPEAATLEACPTLTLARGGDPASVLMAIGGFGGPVSLWSCQIPDTGTRAMLCEGLPSDTDARLLFDAQAPQWSNT